MKPVSDQLFSFTGKGIPAISHERCSAGDLGLHESWLRDAIFKNPELVIGPCRAAGLTDDEWYPWVREYKVETGHIDVLLLSSQARVGIVETKLAGNPELRRRVLAQALDYLTHIADSFAAALPEIPTDKNGHPVADADDIQESVSEGDVLVIVASDEVDARAAKLSHGLLSDHLIKQWDLALIDVALFRPTSGGQHVVVPHLRAAVESEPRQVVRVVVAGEAPKARIEVTRVTADAEASARQKWDEHRFFEHLESSQAPAPVRDLAFKLRELSARYPDSVSLAWGSGKEGSMTLKRRGAGLIEVYGSGKVRVRPPKFLRALGKPLAEEYRRGLESLVPTAMKQEYPRIGPEEAAKSATAIYGLLDKTIRRAENRA